MSKWSLNGWKVLNYTIDQKLPSVIRIRGGNLKIMHFEPIFQLILQL